MENRIPLSVSELGPSTVGKDPKKNENLEKNLEYLKAGIIKKKQENTDEKDSSCAIVTVDNLLMLLLLTPNEIVKRTENRVLLSISELGPSTNGKDPPPTGTC